MLDATDRTPAIQAQINTIAESIIALRKEQTELETLLQTLASQKDSSFHSIPMPGPYGTTHHFVKDDFHNLLMFNPNGKTRFLHVWLSCLKKGEAISKGASKRQPLSKEAWKDALQIHLIGQSLDYT